LASVLETVVAIRDPFEALKIGFIKFFPDLIAVFMLLAFGYLLGWIIGYAVKAILKKAGVDRYVEKSELSKAIGSTQVSSIFGEILKWYVFIIFFGAAVDKIDLGALSGILNSFVLWLPDLIIAIIVILIGLVVAHYVEIKIRENSKMKGIKTLSKFVKWIILFVISISAFKQIGFRVEFIEELFLIVIGALSVGIALALGIGLGLGLKKDAEKFVKGILKNL